MENVSPYLCNPNILDSPDYEYKVISLAPPASGCVLAGSPINAAGVVANDDTAIGILLNDCHTCLGNFRGQVVISGRIKQDVAQSNSGITISDDAKSAMVNISFTGDGCRMGGSSPEVFVAVHGVTTYAETVAAYEAGRLCFAKVGDYIYPLFYAELNAVEPMLHFWHVNVNGLSGVDLSDKYGWQNRANDFQQKFNGRTDQYVGFRSDGDATVKNFPKAAAVADAAGEAPTADEFNALLAALRTAGFLAT